MKTLMPVFAILIFLSIPAYAEKSGTGVDRQKEGMGSSQMKGSQMMSQDMMASMTEMMKNMNHMMERLSHPMHHMTITDHKQMHDLGQIMRKMASEMNEMATHMEKGEMDDATTKKMQDRIKVINQELETLQKKSK